MSTWLADLEGQGSGAGEAGQDLGSPMKKMRMGLAKDAGEAACVVPPSMYADMHTQIKMFVLECNASTLAICIYSIGRCLCICASSQSSVFIPKKAVQCVCLVLPRLVAGIFGCITSTF